MVTQGSLRTQILISKIITRFAPTANGRMHLGHVLNMLYVWGIARALEGTIVLRMEDHDRNRSKKEYEEGILCDLEWLGLHADLGVCADFRGETTPFRQSNMGDAYHENMIRLHEQKLVYACSCSRRELLQRYEILGEKFPKGVEVPYDGHCREASHQLFMESSLPALRIRFDAKVERFHDVIRGIVLESPGKDSGDLLIRDRNENWTYNFAAISDDIRQNINFVIRGEDLFSSTARQSQLIRMLGGNPPLYLHHKLIHDEHNVKLSKRHQSMSLHEYREMGKSKDWILGQAAYQGGLIRRFRELGPNDIPSIFLEEQMSLLNQIRNEFEATDLKIQRGHGNLSG